MTYIFFMAAMAFIQGYKLFHSITVAAIMGVLLGLVLFFCRLIWHSKFRQIFKIIAISIIIVLYGSFLYVFHQIASANTELRRFRKEELNIAIGHMENVPHELREDEIESVRKLYRNYKEINLKQKIYDISQYLSNTDITKVKGADAIRSAVESHNSKLREVIVLLSNPFIFNYSDSSDVKQLQDMVQLIHNELLELSSFSVKLHAQIHRFIADYQVWLQFALKIECDPLKTEYKKILAEDGIHEYEKALDQLFVIGDKKKLLRLTSLKLAEMEHYIDDSQSFPTELEKIIKHWLPKLSRMSNNFLTQNDTQRYMHDCFPKLIMTDDGRKKIIDDIKKLNQIPLIYVEGWCDFVKQYQGKKNDRDEIIRKQISGKIDEIIKDVMVCVE